MIRKRFSLDSRTLIGYAVFLLVFAIAFFGIADFSGISDHRIDLGDAGLLFAGIAALYGAQTRTRQDIRETRAKVYELHRNINPELLRELAIARRELAAVLQEKVRLELRLAELDEKLTKEDYT